MTRSSAKKVSISMADPTIITRQQPAAQASSLVYLAAFSSLVGSICLGIVLGYSSPALYQMTQPGALLQPAGNSTADLTTTAAPAVTPSIATTAVPVVAPVITTASSATVPTAPPAPQKRRRRAATEPSVSESTTTAKPTAADVEATSALPAEQTAEQPAEQPNQGDAGRKLAFAYRQT